MAQPTIPPRPARTQAQPGPQPLVPPRPARKFDPSPDREAFARSPLNFLPGSTGPTNPPPSNLNPSIALKRQPSIDLPQEVGQEGLEYVSYDQLPAAAHGVSEETKNVSADVPLQQPRASVPSSTAKRNIETVTRTDSTQAAAAGIGKARPDDDVHKHPADFGSALGRSRTADEFHARRPPSADPLHPLRARSSFNQSQTSIGGTPRPASIHSDHHYDGIPEIGRQIPLNPFAGDVQAPSPGPGLSQHAPGIGFFNDGSSRAHHRKRSSRHEFGPPGSYGMHGHGMEPSDQFEREWIAKHPQEAAKEGYHTWTQKPAAALTSEQLNRLVNSSEDAGMGTNHAMVGTPTMEIAFDATEKYTAKINSPKPSPFPISEGPKRGSSGAHPAVESPLRKTSFPFNDSKFALAVEDDVIHVDDFRRDVHEHAEHLRRTSSRQGEDAGYGSDRPHTPILASDEVLRRPSSAHMHAAVVSEPRDDDYYYDSDHHHSRPSSLHPHSRPSSRPSSVHSAHGPSHHHAQHGHHGHHGHHGGLHRFVSHEHDHQSGGGTPLEEIEEYEPLFPDDETNTQVKKVIKLRPRLAEHHFPSQDIWEDTPSSLQYVTEVHTPEPPLDNVNEDDDTPASKVFEHPAREEKRKIANPEDMTSDSKTFAKPHFKPEVQRLLQEGHRPGVQRFPSHDIWEDTPDELQLVTTVSGPQQDEQIDQPEERPTTTAIPGSQDDPLARSTTGTTANMRPYVPERPQRGSKLAQELPQDDGREVPDLGVDKRVAPSIPDRPKPTVPARPARHGQENVASGVDAGAQKVKPAVPARPSGSKIAALQAGFMNDLNNRLRQGPQAPPTKEREVEEEEETEKAPLQDARKGRARGPPRRKAHEPSPLSFCITTATLWQIDETDELNVSAAEVPVTEANIEKVLSANSTSNTLESSLGSPPADGTAKEPADEAKLALGSQAVDQEVKDESVQTGEKEIQVTSPGGHKETIVAFADGHAPEEGNVVVNDKAEI